MVLIGQLLRVYASLVTGVVLFFANGNLYCGFPTYALLNPHYLLTIPWFSIFNANFIILANPSSSSVSTPVLNHGLNPFINISSNTSICRKAISAKNLSNLFQYSSTVVSHLIDRNLPTSDPSRIVRNRVNILYFRFFQLLKTFNSSFD